MNSAAQKTDEERARMNERGFDRRDRDFGARRMFDSYLVK